MENTKQIEYLVSKCCISCQSEDIQDLGFKPYNLVSTLINKSKTCNVFTHSNVMCMHCGLIFNKFRPNEEDLNNYYSKQFSYFYYDYDSDKKSEFIFNFLKNSKVERKIKQVLDFGGNVKNEFHHNLEKAGLKVDIEDKEHGNLLKKKYDLITMYYCLEHITDINKVMMNVREKLSGGGYLLIEVPNVDCYFKDTSGLVWEHLQHFSNLSLDNLMRRYGFSKVSVKSSYKTRYFGFVSVYQKQKNVNIEIKSNMRRVL